MTWSVQAAVAGPLIAFAAMLAASLGTPIPAFAALIFVGSLVVQGHGAAYATTALGAAMGGAIIGDVIWFLAGRKYGARVLGLFCRLSLSRDDCVRQTADLFSRQGVRMLLVARFVPGLSIVSAPLAGATGVPLGKFVAFAETGAALWVACYLAVGWWFAAEVDLALAYAGRFGLDAGILALALTGVYACVAWVRRRRLLRRLCMARISVAELAALVKAGVPPTIIDARAAFQHDSDPFIIPGAQLLDGQGGDPAVRGTFQRDSVVVYCSCPNEISAAVVAKRMEKLGYTNVRPLLGGIDAWRAAGFAVAALNRRIPERCAS